jgi:xanthine dehydrogenase/oxidase
VFPSGWGDRMQGLPNEGFTDEYRSELATGLFYKAIVTMKARGIAPPPEIASSGLVTWGKWPESAGTQHYAQPREWNKPVGKPYIKITSMYRCSGQIHYVHELPVRPLTVNAAFVQSRRALANYYFMIQGSDKPVTAAHLRRDLSQRFPSFIDLITHENIRDGGVNLQGMAMDQPLFAEQMVNFVGQSIALAIAKTEQEAIRIAY